MFVRCCDLASRNVGRTWAQRCLPLLALFALAACGKAEIKPVAIVAEDMCAYCRMAISETRYAAELIRNDGEPVKFDDIGCMLHYVEGMGEKGDVAAYFVLDFDSHDWLIAEQAFFVRSSAFKTPMGGGIAAFRERAKAEAALTRYGGKLVRFADLIGEITRSGQNRAFPKDGVFAARA